MKPADDLFRDLIEADRQRLRDAGWKQHPTMTAHWIAPNGTTIKHEEAALRSLPAKED